MSKKGWILVISIVGGLLIILALAIIGGKNYMDNKKEILHEEMVKIVNSDEARNIFEKELKYIDPKSLTDEGTIKNYSIDYKSIKHNPMGGVDVTLIINKSSDLTLGLNLDKDSGKLESGVVVESKKLVSIDDKIQKNKVEDNK